jgi:ABC-2 type transport system ATP-binding protein
MKGMVIQCNNVSKVYRNCRALSNLSFTIEENKIIGLIGRNGAGKTTLLKLLSGFMKQTEGEIKVFGEKPFNSLKVSSNTIFVDDNMAFPQNLTLEEITKFCENFYPRFNQTLYRRLMEYFGINPNKKYRQLSKGMKSTFNIIVGICSRCSLTIMDEPTTGMDAAVRKDFYKVLLKDYLDFPRTIILSSHLLNELEEILEDILLLKNGTMCLQLPLTEVKEYAVSFRGRKDQVNRLTDNREVIHVESFGRDSLYAVVKTENFEGDVRLAKAEGIEAGAVSASDLCIYLTSEREGGIDYVFSKE